MSLKPLLLIPALSAVLLLSACAGPLPQPDPSEAWIGLREEAPNDLLAERVDGKRVDDGRFFEVKPGAHSLDVTLFEEEAGDENQQDCQGRIKYDNFKAGEHYTLVESSLGNNIRARLEDGHGKEVAATQDFNCMPG
ncbi:PA0061/PA0062 family lipoprotein [Pseudomonas sp. SDO528_S397]